MEEHLMNWYYADGGRQAGPVDEAALDELVRQGVVRDDTLVWREGLASWQPHGAARPRPAPPPPAAPVLASPMAPPPSAAETRYCAECGRPYQAYELSMVGSVAVCSTCRPAVVQRMSSNPNPFQAGQPGFQQGAQPMIGGPRRYAGFWIRFVARVIDAILVGIVSSIILIPLTFLGIGGASVLNTTRDPGAALAALPALMGVIGISFILRIALFAAYEIYFVSTRGATPGKMALGLKIIRADGGPVSAGLATGRYFAQFLSGILFIGYIMAGLDPEKRSLHDRLCETRVIYSR
jgi:uncharacterized RDD family membrane protein YckC